MDQTAAVDLASLPRERIATYCVCCGTDGLESSPAILMPFVAHRALGWEPIEIDESWGLRTIPSGHAYSICNTRLCRACDHLFLDIRFSDAEMANLYGGYREADYTRLRDHYEPGYAARNELLAEAVPYLSDIEQLVLPYVRQPLTVLDWGGSIGLNSPFRGKINQVDIFDISNRDVLPGARFVDREAAIAGSYSLIVCSMVLEHSPYPADILLEIRDAMADQSILYLEVPFEELMRQGGVLSADMKKHWHEHVNFFSHKSLATLVGNCGFEVLATNVIPMHVALSSAHVLQMVCRRA